MLSEKFYIEYLEAVVLSLLGAREDSEADIPITDETSRMHGFEVSPINLRHEISIHREDR